VSLDEEAHAPSRLTAAAVSKTERDLFMFHLVEKTGLNVKTRYEDFVTQAHELSGLMGCHGL